MMFPTGSLQLFHELGTWKNYGVCRHPNQFKRRVTRTSRLHVLRLPLLSDALRQDAWVLNVSDTLHRPRYNVFICRSFLTPDRVNKAPVFKAAATALARSYNYLNGTPLVLQLVPAVGIIAFAVWGLGPLMRWSRNLFFKRSDSTWKKSSTYYILTSYLQPLLLWTGATLICRVLDPVTLSSEASQVVKHRLLTFVRSLSTVLAFAYCLSSLVQQAQKFFLETKDSNDARNMGFQFAGKAVYTGVWVAAVSLFMELLGFSTQRWMTAGGLGTVLLTLAGREIFTNFLSSVMIHATRPFVVNEWIQAKIEGYEVSGTVEHVGWWSPTIVRGDDREAVHIPNHKFTVSVVRNLSQKTHWRVKTHIAISHLDASKINNIVADMRKVLAKNAQVEQQRLHRRVFLDDINPENQALLILVSCFVRTSHVEEYLCVKEAILLDLLRVVSHHRARLATPIRTVQKVYADTDLDNIPFAETIFNRAGAAMHRPLLLIESAARIKGEDKTNPRSPHANEEDDTKAAVTPDSKATTSESATSAKNGSHSKQSEKTNVGDAWEKSRKAEVSPLTVVVSDPSINPQLEGLDLMDEKIETLPAAAAAAAAHTKHESERLPMTPPAIARPTLEENIVLGVALEGSKRTLPIEEGMSPTPTPAEAKELVTCRNGNDSKNRKENQVHPSAVAVSDQRDH